MRISKRNGSQTVTDASGKITGNLPGVNAPTLAVSFPALAPQKGDVRVSPKTGKKQQWGGSEWRNLCAVCIEEGRKHPKQAQAGGICVEHGHQTPRCVVCVEEERERPKGVIAGGVCIEHGAQTRRCTTCVEEGRKHPKQAQAGGICIEHGAQRPHCTTCVEEGREHPKQAKAGGVCIEHGAQTRRCTTCVEEGREHPKGVYSGGICIEHGAQTRRCAVCVEEERKEPKQAVAGGICVEHGAQTRRCAVCVEEERKEPKQAIAGGVCIEHGAQTPRCVICVEEERKEPKRAIAGGICVEHGAQTPRCVICVEEERKEPKQAVAGGLCVEHWPRCSANSCDTGAHPNGSGLCSWHEEHGSHEVNDLAWQRRTYRLYCIHYPDLGWVKVGVEASKPSKRVKQWVKAGGVLVDEIILDKEDLAAGRGTILHSIEQTLHSNVLPAMFDQVDPDLYAVVFRDADFQNGPTDGAAETYEAEDWSVAWGLALQAADDADLWRVGEP